MAIGLSQVNTTNKEKAKEVILNKEKIARPWEVKNDIGGSHGASLAVRKAREIVEKNNHMVEEIRQSGADVRSINEVEKAILQRHQEFVDIVEKKSEVQKIKVGSVFSKLLRLFH